MDFMSNVKNTATCLSMNMKQHAPEILTGVGIIGSVAGAVLAAYATTKAVKVVEDHKKELEALKERIDASEPDYKKEVTKVYAKTAGKMVKLYLPAVIAEVGAIGAICATNETWKKKYATLASVALASESMFARYRQNVKDEFGSEVDRRMRFGIKEEEVEVVEKDKDGNDIVTKKKVETISDSAASAIDGYSDYARFFDESCAEWDKNAEYNLTFLKLREAEATERLQRQGHLFLNEVYDMLGIQRSEAGQDVGWIYDKDNPIGDNFVSFGIYELHRERNRAFVNGYEPVILLDFNVDGNIRKRLFDGPWALGGLKGKSIKELM